MKKINCCQKFCCFMFGALLSVLSVVAITIAVTYFTLKEEPMFKSNHHVPTLLSGYNDINVASIIQSKKAQASIFRSEEAIDLDDSSQVEGLQSGRLVIQNGENAYLRASESQADYTWLIDERSCDSKITIRT